MKYVFLLFLIVVFGYVIIVNKNTDTPSNHTPLSSPTTTKSTEILSEEKIFIVHSELISPSTLELIPNFSQRSSSQQIVREHDCKSGVNGGFYTPQYLPLGLFFTNEVWINDSAHRSSLINGYVYQLKNGTFDFANTSPELTQIRFLFQSGPWFTPSSQLSISSDEPDRRMLIGKSTSQHFYFFAVTEKDNAYGGPTLEQLPEIFYKFSHDSGLSITSLINLDGGSASAFVGKEKTLEELTPIGSFLCQK